MRTKIFFAVALLLCTCCGFAQNNLPLVGTWQLVSGKAVMNDSTFTYKSPDQQSLKIVTPTHFSVISKNGSGGLMTHAAAGRVKMDATSYTEILDFSSSAELASKMINFTYRLEGDRWYLKGGVGNVQFDEVWERVKQ